MSDQAATLGKMATGPADGPPQQVRVIAITSGKGGVGKTSTSVNLAYAWAQAGRRVLVVDGDMGLANVEILLGLRPRKNLGHVLRGEADIEEVLIQGPGGMWVLPASSGVKALTRLSEDERMRLMLALEDIEDRFDMLILDTAAGIGENVMFFTSAAQDVVVIVTPEPTSITDAYATIKVMSRSHGVKRVRLLVNQVKSSAEGRHVYNQLVSVADTFLPDVTMGYQGYIFHDPNLPRAVIAQKPLLVRYPDSPAAGCITRVASDYLTETASPTPIGTVGFFWRRLLEQQRAPHVGRV